MVIRISTLDHVVLRARDAESLVVFYRDVLGCVEEHRTSPAFGLIQLRAGDALIDIVAVDGELGRMGGAAPGREGRNMDHFCVRLETFDAVAIRGHLDRYGVEYSETEMRYGAEGMGPSIYVQDPEGNVVELKGPPSSGDSGIAN